MSETTNSSMALQVDRRILAGGGAMLVVGITLTALFGTSMPIGHTGMTEEETLDLLVAQQEIEDYRVLSGILIAVGFMLVIISFGASRKRRRKNSRQHGPEAGSGDEGSVQRI